MSTNVRLYVLMGALLDCGPVQELLGEGFDSLEPLMDKARDGKVGEFVCVYDGMSSEYIAFGRLLACGQDEHGHLEEPFEVHDTADKAELAELVKNAVPGVGPFAIRPLVICHWH